ncbi:MAG: copper amine oxidase N-terminal domain-containing protein [Ruminococcaceae bacterium]|nr:copper amine oxidase N-terminal domain-containing protein [Oscillospiraceae bacterium]
MKKLLMILSLIILISGTTTYADVDFTIERVGYDSYLDVAYNGEVCVVVGYNGQILTSRDFVNWEYCNLKEYTKRFNHVFWIGEKFIAFASEYIHPDNGSYKQINSVYESLDGDQWYKVEKNESTFAGGEICYVLENGDLAFRTGEVPLTGYDAFAICKDYAYVETVYLPSENYRIKEIDTKGGVALKKYYNIIIAENGEEYVLPEISYFDDYLSVPSKDISYDRKEGFTTELNGIDYIVGEREKYSALNPYIRPTFASDFFTQIYGENGFDYSKTAIRNGFMVRPKENLQQLHLYDANLNLFKVKEFESEVSSFLETENGSYQVELNESEGKTVCYSADFENWSTQMPVTVYDYEKVYETAAQENATQLTKIGMWDLIYDKNTNTNRLLVDGIYSIGLNIPFRLREFYEPGRFLFWEEGDTLYIQDGNVRLSTPKQALYDEIEKVSKSPYIVLNDKVLVFDVPPVLEDDRMLVPMRFVFEQMGAEVEWDQATQTATVLQENDAVAFQINNRSATVNSQAQTMDVPARLINGKTMIPIRFLSENLGYTVEWDEETNMAVISD